MFKNQTKQQRSIISQNHSDGGILAGLAGGVLWALDTVILSAVLEPLHALWLAPLAASFLHDLFSSIYMLLIQLVRRRLISLKTLLHSSSVRWMILGGILGGPVGMGAYVLSIRFLGPSTSAALSCLYPAAGILISVLFLRERISKKQAGGLLLSMAAMLALAILSRESGSDAGLGLLFSLICIFAWGSEGLVAAKAMKSEEISSDQALLIRQCVSAIISLLLLLVIPSLRISASQILHTGSLWMIALAALCGTASYLCYYLAIHWIGASRAMPLNITYVLWAPLFAWLLLLHHPRLLELICAILAALGAVLAACSPPSTPADEALPVSIDSRDDQ